MGLDLEFYSAVSNTKNYDANKNRKVFKLFSDLFSFDK